MSGFKHIKNSLNRNDNFIWFFCSLRFFAGALFGGVLGGFFLQYGRRRLLALTSIPFSVSWILTVFAKSVETMYATAFIGGFCCSIVSMVTQVCSTFYTKPSKINNAEEKKLRVCIFF